MRYLITGGTGSFGQAMTARLLKNPSTEVVRIFSRGEQRQAEMADKFKTEWERLRFCIGDVRDKERLLKAMRDIDVVLHAAALKRIEVGEYNPDELIKTNVIGSMNVAECAIGAGVSKCLLLSTDKAVDPANTYGASKMLAEKVFTQAPYAFGDPPTTFLVVRYGNVAGSNGSVIPKFKELCLNDQSLPITHPDMTRFIITMDMALDLVMLALKDGESGEIFIRKLPAARLAELAEQINSEYAGRGIKVTGIGPGEKLHECLVSQNELPRAFEYDDHYVITPLIGNREQMISKMLTEPITSDKARVMTAEEIRTLI